MKNYFFIKKNNKMPLAPTRLLYVMESEAFCFLTQEDQFTKVHSRMGPTPQGGVMTREEMNEDKAGLEVLGRCQESFPNQGTQGKHHDQFTAVIQHPTAIPEYLFCWVMKLSMSRTLTFHHHTPTT